MSLADKYQSLKEASNPSLIDRFETIENHLATLVKQNLGLVATLDDIASALAKPVRISTWGSSHLVFTNTDSQLVPNHREVVAFSAWVEGAALAMPGISLIFNDTMVSPFFQQTISGVIPNPSKVALSAVPTAPVHVMLLTSAIGGWGAR